MPWAGISSILKESWEYSEKSWYNSERIQGGSIENSDKILRWENPDRFREISQRSKKISDSILTYILTFVLPLFVCIKPNCRVHDLYPKLYSWSNWDRGMRNMGNVFFVPRGFWEESIFSSFCWCWGQKRSNNQKWTLMN